LLQRHPEPGQLHLFQNSLSKNNFISNILNRGSLDWNKLRKNSLRKNQAHTHPAAVSDHYISPIDGPKYHLRRRTPAPIPFRFLSKDAATLTRNDPQYVDHDTLTAISP
jgi:hypothetical protein